MKFQASIYFSLYLFFSRKFLTPVLIFLQRNYVLVKFRLCAFAFAFQEDTLAILEMLKRIMLLGWRRS